MIDAVDTVLEDPSTLLSFQLLTYSDLKAYKFTYWVGIPAVIPVSTHGFMGTSSVTLKDWMMIRSSSSSSGGGGVSSSDRSSVVDVMNENQLCIQLYRELIHHLITFHRGNDHHHDNVDDHDDDDGAEGDRAFVLQCIFGLYISNDIDHNDHRKDDGDDSTDVNVYDDTIIDVSNSNTALLVESFESSVLIDADADADESNVEAIGVQSKGEEEERMFINNKPVDQSMWQYEEIIYPPNSNKKHGVDGHDDGIDGHKDDIDGRDDGCSGSSGSSGSSGRRRNAKVLSFKDAWPLRYDKSMYFVIVDPSSSSSSGYGWIVRNLLAMLSLHLPERDIYEDEDEETKKTAKIINFRGMVGNYDDDLTYNDCGDDDEDDDDDDINIDCGGDDRDYSDDEDNDDDGADDDNDDDHDGGGGDDDDDDDDDDDSDDDDVDDDDADDDSNDDDVDDDDADDDDSNDDDNYDDYSDNDKNDGSDIIVLVMSVMNVMSLPPHY